MWNTATFASRVFIGWPSPVPASRSTIGTPVPSALRYIVSAGASANAGADRSHAAISRPTCFAATPTPHSRPRLSAASSNTARSAAGVSRAPGGNAS